MLAVGLSRHTEGVVGFEIPHPQFHGPQDVLVKVLQSGVCGTDRDMIARNLRDIAEGEDYIVLGHEAVGRVVAVGPQVQSLRVGDIVLPTVRRGCGQCPSCLNNQSDMCSTGRYRERGIHQLHGFFTEYFVDEEMYLVKVPPGLEHSAILAEPLSIGEKAMAQLRLVQSRLPWGCLHPEHRFAQMGWGACKTALVIGAGPIGFFGTALLRLAGIKTYVLEIVPPDSLKVRLAQEMDAHYIDGRGLTAEALVDQIGNPDIIYEASGASELALSLIPTLARNGIYIFTGIPRGGSQVCLDGDLLIRQVVRFNQVILGSINANRSHVEAAMTDLLEIERAFPHVIDRTITHVFSLVQYKEALGPVGPDRLKVIFQMEPDIPEFRRREVAHASEE